MKSYIVSGLTLTASVLALSACTPMGPNQWMPKGYTYQDDTPISSPAPSSPWLESAVIENTDKIAASTAAWQGAAFELVDGLGQYLPKNGGPINVMTIPPRTNQDLALDHYTRQALMQKGLTLTTTPNMGLTLHINTEPLTKPEILKKAESMKGFEFIGQTDVKDAYLLCAHLKTADGKEVGKSSTVGIFPYEKREYSRMPGYTDYEAVGIVKTDPAKNYNQ